jgi:hypothetical protein
MKSLGKLCYLSHYHTYYCWWSLNRCETDTFVHTGVCFMFFVCSVFPSFVLSVASWGSVNFAVSSSLLEWRFLYSYERYCLLERFWNILLCLSSFISACNTARTLLFTWIKWNLDKEPTVFNWQIVTAADVALDCTIGDAVLLALEYPLKQCGPVCVWFESSLKICKKLICKEGDMLYECNSRNGFRNPVKKSWRMRSFLLLRTIVMAWMIFSLYLLPSLVTGA